MQNTISQYINRIRNESKKQYARQYFDWLASGEQGTEPDRPTTLSAMAAQAVRIDLHKAYHDGMIDMATPYKVPKRISSLQRIKNRMQSRNGYSRLVEGVNTFDIPKMAEDMRALLARVEQSEHLLDLVLDWALSNRNTADEFVTCHTYHGSYPITLSLVKEYMGEKVRKDVKLVNDIARRAEQDKAARERFARYRREHDTKRSVQV